MFAKSQVVSVSRNNVGIGEKVKVLVCEGIKKKLVIKLKTLSFILFLNIMLANQRSIKYGRELEN